MFLRINSGLKTLAGKPPFQYRMGVAVPFKMPDGHGLPTSGESAHN